MKKALLALMFLSVSLMAQTPSQFAGLLTNSTNYSGGYASTWTPPAPGSAITDALFGNTIFQLPTPTDCAPQFANCAAQIASPSGIGFMNQYSKTMMMSRDKQYILATDQSGWFYLYHITSLSPFAATFVRRIQVNSSGVSIANGNTIAGAYANIQWAKSGGHILYYLGYGSNGFQSALWQYNLDADTGFGSTPSTIVHDFSALVATYNTYSIPFTCNGTPCGFGASNPGAGQYITMQGEGNQSDNDDIWAFGINNNQSLGNDNNGVAVVVYKKSTDTVLASMTLGPGGVCGTLACFSTPNWVGASPLGDYIVINWNCETHMALWPVSSDITQPISPTPVHGCGAEVYTTSLSFLGIADVSFGHADQMVDKNGHEVYVTLPDGLYSSLAATRLDSVATTIPNGNGWAGEHAALWPSTFAYAAYTISGRGSHGAAQGWGLYSVYPNYTCSSVATCASPGGFNTMENDAFLVDWDNWYPHPNDGGLNVYMSYVRLGRTHALDDCYFCQPNAVPNYDFTNITWTSNGDIDVSNPTFMLVEPLPGAQSFVAQFGGHLSISGSVTF